MSKIKNIRIWGKIINIISNNKSINENRSIKLNSEIKIENKHGSIITLKFNNPCFESSQYLDFIIRNGYKNTDFSILDISDNSLDYIKEQISGNIATDYIGNNNNTTTDYIGNNNNVELIDIFKNLGKNIQIELNAEDYSLIVPSYDNETIFNICSALENFESLKLAIISSKKKIEEIINLKDDKSLDSDGDSSQATTLLSKAIREGKKVRDIIDEEFINYNILNKPFEVEINYIRGNEMPVWYVLRRLEILAKRNGNNQAEKDILNFINKDILLSSKEIIKIEKIDHSYNFISIIISLILSFILGWSFFYIRSKNKKKKV